MNQVRQLRGGKQFAPELMYYKFFSPAARGPGVASSYSCLPGRAESARAQRDGAQQPRCRHRRHRGRRRRARVRRMAQHAAPLPRWQLRRQRRQAGPGRLPVRRAAVHAQHPREADLPLPLPHVPQDTRRPLRHLLRLPQDLLAAHARTQRQSPVPPQHTFQGHLSDRLLSFTDPARSRFTTRRPASHVSSAEPAAARSPPPSRRSPTRSTVGPHTLHVLVSSKLDVLAGCFSRSLVFSVATGSMDADIHPGHTPENESHIFADSRTCWKDFATRDADGVASWASFDDPGAISIEESSFSIEESSFLYKMQPRVMGSAWTTLAERSRRLTAKKI